VIDVVPLGPGLWLARCECGETQKFLDATSGWEWVLAHPCEPQPDERVIDLNRPSRSRLD